MGKELVCPSQASRAWKVPQGAPVSAHCLVDFGSGTSQGRENVCSLGSPEEKEQGFSFGL